MRIPNLISLFVFALMSYSLDVSAQTDTVKVFVGGEVFDGDANGERVAWATVRLRSAADSTQTYSTATDQNGVFRLEDIIKGKYNMEVSCVGYETESRTVMVGNDTILPSFVLKESAHMLNEVLVNAKYTKMNHKGGYVVQVKGNPLAKVSSTENFLSTIRGISISDDIRVFGKQGVIIVLNDRVISYKQLKEIPTSMIERIELEQQAPSEYVSGGVKPPLLRVVLRNEPGLLGSVGLSSWYCMDESWALTETANALLSLGKFSLLNNFSNTNGFWRDGIKQDVFYADHETHQKSESRQKLKRSLQNDLTMRYSFTPYDHIDVNASYSTHKESGKLLNTGDVALFNEHGHDSNYGNGVSVKMVKGLKKDGVSKVSVKGSYSESHFKEDRKYEAFSSGVQLMDIDNGRYNADISTILTYAIGRSHSLKVGVNYNRISELNSYKNLGGNTVKFMDDTDNRLSVAQTHGMVEYENTIAGKYNLKAEMNFDHYRLGYDDHLAGARIANVSNGLYGSVSGYIPFNQEKQRYLNMSAIYTFSYPNYGYYSPVVVYQNDKLYNKGNPDLDVEKLYIFELAYSANPHLSINYGFSHRTNFVSVFMHQDSTDPTVYYTCPENAGHENVHSLVLSYRVNPFRIWTVNAMLVGEYKNTHTPNERFNAATAFLSVHSYARLTNNTGLKLRFEYKAPSKSVNVKKSGNYVLSLGAYASFCKNHLNMDLTGYRALCNKVVTTTSGDGWRMERRNRYSEFRIAYNLSWNFNFGKKINGRRVESVSTSAKERPTL